MFEALVAFHILGIILMIFSLFIMFRGESTYAQKLVIYFIVAEIVHNAGYLLELFSKSLAEAFLAVKFEYIGSSLVVVFFMMFIRHYCGLKERIVFERALLLCAALGVVMVWTSPAHDFYYKEISFVNGGLFPHLELAYGPGFYIHTGLTVVIPWLVVLHAFVYTMVTDKEKSKQINLIWIVLGTMFSFVGFVLYVLRVFPGGYDPTCITMAYMLSMMVIFIWNRKDFNLTRAAANTVLNSLGDCMITLDESYKVLIYNSAAKELFPDITIYQRIDDIEGFPIHFLAGESRYEFEIGDKHYEGHIRPLEDFEHIVRGYTVLIVDVTSTYEYIKEVTEMREKAEEANRAKSDFLANMSHEIRTPMNAVVGMSELIIEESRGRKMYDYACNIKSAALNLLSIINDILDLSKVEAGKMELVEDEYFVQVLVQDTVNLVQMAAEQKGLQMKVQLADDIPHKLYGDEGRIRQVLINILNNSIKFTQEGYVSIAVSSTYLGEDEICMQFVIEDTGIGIKKEDMNSIFESFRQLDMNKNRKTEGTGLGLAITKNLVALMQGDIQVESEYGSGTCFTIQIKQRVVDKRTVKDMPMTRHAAEVKNGQMFVCKDYRVLVVDDNMINRKVATAMLASYGFQIHEASSGKAAIDLVKKNVYDIIFMDHMMPEMDGVETTQIIREECKETASQTVIVALTANAIQGAKEMYLENGFEDFLSKPFERIQMHELLERWVPQEVRDFVDEKVEESKASEDDIAEIFMSGVNVRKIIMSNDLSINEYLTMIYQFKEDSENKKPLLCKLAQEKKIEQYAMEIHTLRSAAAKIGAENLSAEAKLHEKAIHQGEFDYVDNQYAQLILNYERVLQEIERILRKKKYQAS